MLSTIIASVDLHTHKIANVYKCVSVESPSFVFCSINTFESLVLRSMIFDSFLCLLNKSRRVRSVVSKLTAHDLLGTAFAIK